MTLVMDAAQQPLTLVTVHEAVATLARDILDGAGRVQALVVDETRRFRSRHLDLPTPLIIQNSDIDPRILYTKLHPKDTAKVSRRVLFARDRYECQYCSFIADSRSTLKQLTVDHVRPARLFNSRAEATTWENVVTACRSCNARKGGKLPYEAHMQPRCVPKKPDFVQLRFAGRLNAQQRDYLVDYGYVSEDVGLGLL